MRGGKKNQIKKGKKDREKKKPRKQNEQIKSKNWDCINESNLIIITSYINYVYSPVKNQRLLD